MKAPLCAAVAAACSLATAIAHADEAPPPTPLNPVVVTATRTPSTEAETLAAVTVITRDEIARAQAGDIADLLRFTAGIDIGRTGGPGQQTAVFIRGGNSNQTLVLVDGVRINTATGSGGAVQNIAPDMIERIEIVKGPRATLYGSDAIGGVVNIITRGHGNGGDVSLQAGSFNAREISGDARYDANGNSLSLFAQNSTTDGIPSCDSAGPDRAYNRSTVDLKGGTHAGPVELGARVWNTQGSAQYMDFCGAGNSPVAQDFRNHVIETEASLRPTGHWLSTLSLSHMIDDIRQLNPNFLGAYDFARTQRPQADWHNVLALGEANRLSFGATAARETVEALSFGTPIHDGENLYTVFAQDELNRGRHHALGAVSYGHYGSFGSHVSWNAEYGYDLFAATRLIASGGSGFRAPNASDRFGFGGNPRLKPEEARNLELGLKQRLGAHQALDLRLFRSDVTDLINVVCDANFNCLSVNVNRYRNQGAELSYQLEVADWSARLSAVAQNPVDRTTDTVLARRARRSVSGQLARHFGPGYLALDVLGSGPRNDVGGRDGGYALLALSGGVQLDEHFSLNARLDNLLDKRYETAKGYRQPGANGNLSLRFAF
ncbi:MAG: TonB-dependent receptor [Nevskiaceae bacterium]|nr:MAG: TonB-dependent receptor [Nevskiaceae bacterium]